MPSDGSSPDAPNYLTVDVPPETDPTEYAYVERRADLLDHVLAKGSPRAVHQARLADHYGVSEAIISKEMDRIGADIAAHLTADLDLETLAMRERVVTELFAQDRPREAGEVHLEWFDWLGVESPTDTPRTTVAGGGPSRPGGDPAATECADPRYETYSTHRSGGRHHS